MFLRRSNLPLRLLQGIKKDFCLVQLSNVFSNVVDLSFKSKLVEYEESYFYVYVFEEKSFP